MFIGEIPLRKAVSIQQSEGFFQPDEWSVLNRDSQSEDRTVASRSRGLSEKSRVELSVARTNVYSLLFPIKILKRNKNSFS